MRAGRRRFFAACFLLLLYGGLSVPGVLDAAGVPETEEAFETGYDDIDYNEIQGVMDQIMGEGQSFSFQNYVEGFFNGEKKLSLIQLGKDLFDGVKKETAAERNTLLRLISIAVIAAVFTNFSSMFQNSQVSETGFYITYLLLFSVLTASFYTASALAGQTLASLLAFMKALVPAYFLSVAFTAGAASSALFYESTLAFITLADMVLVRFVLPAVHIYFLLSLANNFAREDMLSRLSELLELIIHWTLKTLTGAVIGFHVIQGLLVPAVDYVKRTVWMKTLGSLPGVGNAFGAVAETVLGAGVLLKNAIGAAGMVVILLICALPLLKLVIYTLIYKAGAAVVQPVSDKRILNCISGASKAARLLLYTTGIGALLFLLTLTLVTASTGARV